VREERPAGSLPAMVEAAVRRQRNDTECCQGLARQERGTGKGSAARPPYRKFDGDLSRKKAHIISKLTPDLPTRCE
jgi:hypothetical protein